MQKRSNEMSNIGWVYGILKHENVDTDEMSPEEAFEALEALREQERREYAESKTQSEEHEGSPKEEHVGSGEQSKKHVELPKEEYAGLCSAIRTNHADKIPKKGDMLYKDSYYRYTYDKNSEQILCTYKINIVDNEKTIDSFRKERDNGIK